MARGGKSSRRGRSKRPPARKTPRKPRRGKPPADGLSPVEIIIGMMRGDLPFNSARFKAAVAAAPYVHARRGAAGPAEEPRIRHEDALKELE